MASLLNILFIAFGLLPTLGMQQIEEFLLFQYPKSLTYISCINPRFAFGMYRFSAAVNPFGPGFSDKELFPNSLSGIFHLHSERVSL
jgi:hypothetical protein